MNEIQKSILKGFALCLVLGAWLLTSIELFQSPWPFAAWASITILVVALIAFPYSKFFSSNNNSKPNQHNENN